MMEQDAEALATVRLGVSLRGLRKLRARLVAEFGEQRFAEISTAEVNALFVERLTEPTRVRLAELPQAVAREDIGPPTYFISHAWCNKASFLFQYVDEFLAAADEMTCVWLDIVSVNQHEDTVQHHHDIAAFKEVVRACSGGTIVVVDVAQCNPATRGWCIFEWSCTLAIHGPDALHMALSPQDRGTVCRSLDVEAAETRFPADKAMILADVVSHHGSASAFDAKLWLQLMLEPLSCAVDVRRLQQRAEGTAWDFTAVEDWLAVAGGSGGSGEGGGGGSEGGPSRVLCVVSGAGEGKSSISAALLGGPLRERGEAGVASPVAAAAHHFFKYNDARRQELVRVIKSLAFQLAARLPAVRDALLALDPTAVVLLSDAEAAFKMLLEKPLLQALGTGAPSVPPVVILLDALDEADPADEQQLTQQQWQQQQQQHQQQQGPADCADSSGGGGGGALAAPAGARAPRVSGNAALALLTAYLARLPPRVARVIVTTRPDAAAGQVLPCLRRAFGGDGAAGGVTEVTPARFFWRQAGASAADAPAASGATNGGTGNDGSGSGRRIRRRRSNRHGPSSCTAAAAARSRGRLNRRRRHH